MFAKTISTRFFFKRLLNVLRCHGCHGCLWQGRSQSWKGQVRIAGCSLPVVKKASIDRTQQIWEMNMYTRRCIYIICHVYIYAYLLMVCYDLLIQWYVCKYILHMYRNNDHNTEPQCGICGTWASSIAKSPRYPPGEPLCPQVLDDLINACLFQQPPKMQIQVT